jgi:hypothetical protein
MDNDLTLLEYSANKIPVYYHTNGSHATTHFEDTPQLLDLVREAFGTLAITKDTTVVTVDFGRRVGMQDLVRIDETDEIVYAKRKHRETYSVFTKSQRPQPSALVTLVITQEEGLYVLKSVWIGPADPPFPGDEYESPGSREYWRTHALAWGTQEIDTSSLTTVCPW